MPSSIDEWKAQRLQHPGWLVCLVVTKCKATLQLWGLLRTSSNPSKGLPGLVYLLLLLLLLSIEVYKLSILGR
jgi:hypothetical protein